MQYQQNSLTQLRCVDDMPEEFNHCVGAREDDQIMNMLSAGTGDYTNTAKKSSNTIQFCYKALL